MKHIVSIACTSKKVARPERVKDLHQSALFQKSLTYAEGLRPDAILILSAKHELLAPERPFQIVCCKSPCQVAQKPKPSPISASLIIRTCSGAHAVQHISEYRPAPPSSG